MRSAVLCIVAFSCSVFLCIGCSEKPHGCPECQILCGNQCVYLLADDNHCGECDNACEIDQDCINGACECSSESRTMCNGSCVNIDYDNENCGRCGNACGVCEQCIGGYCYSSSCPPPFFACTDINGCLEACIDDQNDDEHCGGCYKKCPDDYFCADGMCQYRESCSDRGLVNCNGHCVDTNSDPEHCGECNNDCDGMDCIDGWCA